MSGRQLPLPPATVQRAVEMVLEGERVPALISVNFIGRDAMRRLNAAYKRHDRPTDVLTFALTEPGGRRIGDIYICPWVAAREAKARGIPLREELIRLVVHGALHATGREHPEGAGRERSAMWRRQERYMEALR